MTLQRNIICTGIVLGSLLTTAQSSPINILDSKAYKERSKDLDKNTFLGKPISEFLYFKLSEKDRSLLMRVLIQALESSPSFLIHKWHNIDTGNKGTINVLPVFTQGDHKCRDFEVKIFINDKEFIINNSACRMNEEWKIALSIDN
jgi:surface antigen